MSVRSVTGPFAIIPEWLIYHPSVSDRAIRLYATLHRHEGAEGAYPSRARLASLLNCSLPSVDRAIDELRAAGALIISSRQRDDGGNTSNLYTLNPNPSSPVIPPLITGEYSPLITRDQTVTIASKNEIPTSPYVDVGANAASPVMRGYTERYDTLLLAFGPSSDPKILQEFAQIAEEHTQDDIVTAIAAARRTSQRVYPSRLWPHLPGYQAPGTAPPQPKKLNLDPFDLEGDTYWAKQIRAEREQGIT